MAAGKKASQTHRKLSSTSAKKVARKLQLRTYPKRQMGMKGLSRKSTATGRGAVVFRASRVLSAYAAKSRSS